MLDKSMSYKNIIMKIDWGKLKSIKAPVLPDGFSFRFFTAGDEEHWARIEASVLEFDSATEAKDYFEKSYIPHMKHLQKRCIFVCNKDELPIATTNSWFADSKELGHQSSLHWVAVCPEYQRLGIGQAIVQQALVNFQELAPNMPVWLHTQTWSHAAIRLYHRLGFSVMKNGKLANNDAKIYQNDFDEAMQVLQAVISEKMLDEICKTAK